MLDDLEMVKAACCIAGIDGRVGTRERRVLDELADRAGVGRASVDAMIDRAMNDDGFFEQQLMFLQGDPDDAIKTLFRVALVDNELGTEERVLLQYFADRLEMTQDRFDEILAAAEKHLRR